MNTRISTTERLGRAFGRGWRSYARGEQQLVGRLVSQGMPISGATTLVWIVKLVVLGVLFYIAFWLTLVLLLGVATTWVAGNSCVNNNRWGQPEDLRNGEAGFGLYSSNGQRIDPHDPNDPFDD